MEGSERVSKYLGFSTSSFGHLRFCSRWTRCPPDRQTDRQVLVNIPDTNQIRDLCCDSGSVGTVVKILSVLWIRFCSTSTEPPTNQSTVWKMILFRDDPSGAQSAVAPQTLYLEAYRDNGSTDFFSHHELFSQHGQDDVLPEPTGQTFTETNDPLPPTAVRLILRERQVRVRQGIQVKTSVRGRQVSERSERQVRTSETDDRKTAE